MLLVGLLYSDSQASTFGQIRHKNSTYGSLAYNGLTDNQLSVNRQPDLLGLLIAGDVQCNPGPGLGMLLKSGDK